MSDRIQLSEFDPETRERLSGLSRHEINLLSIQARREADEADQSSWPKDPKEAAAAALKVLATAVQAEVDDGLSEVEMSLRLAVLILSRPEDLDEPDAEALAWLLDRATWLTQKKRALTREASERLWLIGRGQG